jgi:PAS domain S-box-containing protein
VLGEHAANLGERAAVAGLCVDLYVTLGQPDRASAASLDYLRHLGIEWSAHPTDEDVRREYDQIWSQIGTRAIEGLIDLPVMSDPISLGTLDVLTKAILPAWFTDRNLGYLVTCRAANLSLERGNSDSSCTAYEYLGIIAGPRFGNYKAGEQFGRLGYDLVEKRGLRRFQSRTYMLFGNVIMPWTTHIRSGRDLVRRAFDVANAVGDLTFAAFSCKNLNTNLLAAGDPLAEVQREAESGLEFAKNIRFGFAIDTIRTQLALIRTLRGLTREFGCFDDDGFEEVGFERHLASSPALVLPEFWYWTRKLQARLLAGDNAGAVDAALSAQRLVWTSPSWFETAECHFYGALAHAVCCDSTSEGEDRQHLESLTAHHRQLAVWAENCPENFENRAALVGAEIARVEGRSLDAEALYEQAIHSAHMNGFVHNEALANELAGRFYAARGFQKVAQTYLREARYFYGRWGAQGKVRQLDELYPDLIAEHVSINPAGTIRTPVEHLELATVIKVSQAVSGEIVLEKLIDVLMRTAIEHAGAERGLLLLPRGDALHIVAEATTSGDTIIVRSTDAPCAAERLPESIAQYVTRTQETVVLNDTSAQNPFAADAYIRAHRTRSILCLPLIRQRRLIGILHLENNLAAHVFTSTRLAVLALLASQAAISLENTRLFADRKQAEEELRRSEADLHEAQRLSHTGSWKLDLRSGRVSGSPEVFRVFGVQSDEESASQDFWFNRIHHEDRQRVRDHFDRCVAQKVEYDGAYRIVLPDGSIKYLHVIGHPIVDESGAVSEFLGTAMDVTEQVQARVALESAFEEITRLRDRLRDENLALKEEIAQASMFEEVVGASAPLKAVLSRVTKVAPTDSTVLLTGETGTGKELIARAIHGRSQRSSHAFVSVNCAAIPASLIASELFGHEKGAFTGASGRRVGRFELAEDGTIFLDEVGELPAETQVTLLRVLQEREFERVGGSQRIRANARVVAATNRDLDSAIAAGTFRSDLFYRLNVFPIEVPPLRERKEDIPLLVEYFIARFARKIGKTIRGISKNTLDLLVSYPWPGNIRELQNVVERSMIVCETETFSVDESWLSRQAHGSQPTPHLDLAQLAVLEKEIIEAALHESGGRASGPSGAATKLGIPGSTLESKIKSLGINKNRFKK